MKWRSARVLVIDDNPGDLMLAKLAFEESALDVEVCTADTCADGVEKLRRCNDADSRPDLVLLDLNLTDGTGFDLLRVLRRERDLQEVPAVVLSTSSDPQDQSQAAAMGADAYLVKPSSFSRFTEMVQALAKHLKRHPPHSRSCAV